MQSDSKETPTGEQLSNEIDKVMYMNLATWSEQHSITEKVQDDDIRTSVASNHNGNLREVPSTFFSTKSQKKFRSINSKTGDRSYY